MTIEEIKKLGVKELKVIMNKYNRTPVYLIHCECEYMWKQSEGSILAHCSACSAKAVSEIIQKLPVEDE